MKPTRILSVNRNTDETSTMYVDRAPDQTHMGSTRPIKNNYLRMKSIISFLTLALAYMSLNAQNIEFDGLKIEITGTNSHISTQANIIKNTSDVAILDLLFNSDSLMNFPAIAVNFTTSSNDVQNLWTPASKGLRPDWGSKLMVSRATTHAPVYSLYTINNRNKLTVSVSDAMNSVLFNCGLNEESSNLIHKISFFTEAYPPIKSYHVQIRFDKRDLFLWNTLNDVSKWWSSMDIYKPALVPDIARLPMYSTWYSFHQQVSSSGMLEQCKLSKSIGCESIIVDDGWQTLDNNRGYAYCGEWKPERVPNMKRFVDSVHQLGMKCLVWYSVPYVGEYSPVFKMFEDKLLFSSRRKEDMVGVLDPRFPEVRRYLIDVYKAAMTEWGLDGFKLDFIDKFILTKGDEWVVANNYTEEAVNGRDYASVNEAVDRLMTDIMHELRAINPEVMIEFRQSYIGPLMRKYGNMFRSGDCPNNSITNRKQIADIRLIAGNTAVHADPLMWSPDETAEVAAQQLLSTIFSVPQVSVMLDKYPPSHYEMLRFWLGFWRANRDVLLDGLLEARNPELNYPLLISRYETRYIAAVYLQGMSIPLEENQCIEFYFINGSGAKGIIVDLKKAYGKAEISINDCYGKVIEKKELVLKAGIIKWDVPASGLLTIRIIK